MKAVWNGVVLADSEETIVIEGNHYFPPSSLVREYFAASDTRSLCPWKGTASYFTIQVQGEINEDSAWVYPEPSEAARQIAGYVAFWKGIEVQ